MLQKIIILAGPASSVKLQTSLGYYKGPDQKSGDYSASSPVVPYKTPQDH